MKKIIAALLAAFMLILPAAAMHVDESNTTQVWMNSEDCFGCFDTFLLEYGDEEKSMMELYGVGDGGGADTLSSHPVYVADETGITCRGWLGLHNGHQVAQYGYRINGGEHIYNDEFKLGAEQAVYNAGGDSRYKITVPIEGRKLPTLITMMVKDVYGNEYDFIEFSINGNYIEQERVCVYADGVGKAVQARAGDTVKIKIRVESNASLDTLKAKVSWPDTLTLTDAVYGTDSSFADVSVPADGWGSVSGSYTFSWTDDYDTIDGDFTLAELTFTVDSDIEEDVFLPITVFLGKGYVSSVSGRPVSIEVFDGAVKAVMPDEGDVNCDGAFDNKDVVALFRYVSGDLCPVFNTTIADVNGDKKINNKDVTALFRLSLLQPSEPSEVPVVLGISDIGGKYLVYGSAEVDSVIRTEYPSGKTIDNVCNNKYFYIEVPVNYGDQVTFYATAPGKLISEGNTVSIIPNTGGGNVWGGRNSRIFYSGTYGFLTGNQADMGSLANLKAYIANKTIKEIQTATGKETKLIYAIIPDPATAYYDEQNEGVYVPQPLNTAMQSFVAEINGCHKDVYALDLFSVMRANKDKRIYFSTDTHYTEYGAYYVYLEIMNKVREAFPDATARTIENGDYTVEFYDVPGGDMCGMIGMSMNEVVPFFIANFEDTGSYYLSKRADGIKSAGFGPGGWQRDSELQDSNNPTAYFLGDSYGCYILPFIGANFSKVWTNPGVLWSYSLDKSILEQNKPDYVILLVCQRNVGPNFMGNLITDFSMSVSGF